MNGGHDLGGMHGLGPVDAEPELVEPVFHAQWERRVFALVRATSALGRWTVDMSRHARERQHPATYLRHSYYENWYAGLVKLLVEKGLLTAEELATGKAAGACDDEVRKCVLLPSNVPSIVANGAPSTMPADAEPSFGIGARVRAVNRHPLGHTREPRYVRGRVGVIHAHHGAHVLPDLSAEGERVGRHLYTVRFEATELWGSSADGKSAVYVDLWQDYLEPA
jgi:nitrile hydratase subunit beta